MPKSRFEQTLTVLVGIAAVVAASLATLQLDAGRKGDRASLLGARLPVRIFERIAASGIRSNYHIETARNSIGLGLEGLARQLTAARASGAAADFETSLGGSQFAASKRLQAAAAEMEKIDPRSRGVDPATAAAILATVQQLQQDVKRQGELVDASSRYGSQGSRAIFGLSLAAIAAALLGLAAVLRLGAGGRIALVAGTVALVASVGWGAWAAAT